MVIGLLLLLPAVLASQPPGDTATFTWREVLAAGTILEVRGVIGSIIAEETAGAAAEVTGMKRGGRHGNPATVEIRVVRTGSRVIICTLYPRDERWSRHDDEGLAKDACEAAQREKIGRGVNDTRVDYRVRVPHGVHFVGQTVTDEVRLNGLRGNAEGYSIAGDVTITDVRGGVIDAASISGDISFDRIDADRVYAGTLSGDVIFGGAIRRFGEYSLLTHTGTIIVTLAAAAGVSLSVAAPRDHVRSALALTNTSLGRRRYAARQGDGSARMDLTTLNGEIRIRTAE